MEKISIRNAKNAIPGLIELANYIKANQSDIVTIIEIGSYVGDSTKIWAEYFEEVIAIDPWENGYDDNDSSSWKYPMSKIEKQFDHLCNEYPNIVKWKMSSEKAAKKFKDNTVQFVYIDGLHTYKGVMNDLQLWYPKIKKGYFIAGHDYGSKHHPGVKQAVDKFLNGIDKRFLDSSWIRRKNE